MDAFLKPLTSLYPNEYSAMANVVSFEHLFYTHSQPEFPSAFIHFLALRHMTPIWAYECEENVVSWCSETERQ